MFGSSNNQFNPEIENAHEIMRQRIHDIQSLVYRTTQIEAALDAEDRRTENAANALAVASVTELEPQPAINVVSLDDKRAEKHNEQSDIERLSAEVKRLAS